MEPAEAYGFVEMDSDSRAWYEKAAAERERMAETENPYDPEAFWGWGANVRQLWIQDQWWDKEMWPYFERAKTGELEPEVRLAPTDGLLEREVPTRQGNKWVPIVPNGRPLRHLTWFRWVFLQLHVGIFGAHRSAKKTLIIATELVWWATMKTDFARWVGNCLTCLRFRSRPTKQEQGSYKPTHFTPMARGHDRL